MSKDAYYFSHDSNARHDPKITAMRAVYGSEGYGWYWMLIEMMRESEGYKLSMQGKYAMNAYAMQLHTTSDAFASFVQDCVYEFELFKSDDTHFWSDSLLKRMELREERSEKASKAAQARWSKKAENAKGDANALKSNADASKNDALKERKGKEIKGKESKENKEIIPLSFSEIESIKDEILKIINNNGITKLNLATLDDIYSYIGMVDKEVIIKAMNKSTGKTISYAKSVLAGMVHEDNITTKEQLEPKIDFPRNKGNKGNFSKSSKPQIPTVQSNESAPTMSEEELAEIRKIAAGLDNRKNGGS